MTTTGGTRVNSRMITTFFRGARLLSHERTGAERGSRRVDSRFDTREVCKDGVLSTIQLVLCMETTRKTKDLRMLSTLELV